MPTLPLHYQEAILFLSEKEKGYEKRFDISEEVVKRFADYKQLVLSKRDKKALSRLLYSPYGNTYWFYLMFK